MKKSFVLFLLLTILCGSLVVSFSTENPSITWVDLKDYYYCGSWNDLLIFKSNWEFYLRIYNETGKLLLELDDCYSFSEFDDFIAIARMVPSDDFEYYSDLSLFGETEEIRENALKQLKMTYIYDYYDKNLKKIAPTKAVVKYLDDGYSSGAVGGGDISGNYADASEKKIYSKYYVIAPLEMIDRRKVGLSDSSGNVLIEPSYDMILSYYDAAMDKLYFIMHDSIIDQYGEERYYIVKILDESLKVVFNVPSKIGGLEPYNDSSGRIILSENSHRIRAFTMEGEEVLKGIEKTSFYEKNGWYYIQVSLTGGANDFYRLNLKTNEKQYLQQLSYTGNVGAVHNGFDYFYYKRLDGGDPDIKFQSLNVGYYFEDDSPRICAFSTIEGYVTDLIYDANYGYLGRIYIYPGLIAVKKNGKVGLLDRTFKETTKFLYDDIDPDVHADRIMAIKDGKYGYLDTTGKEVIPFVFKKAYNFNAYGFAHVEGEFGNTKLIDKYGKIVYESKDRVVWFAEAYDIDTNYVTIEDNNRIGWFENYIYDPNLYIHRISKWAKESVLKAIAVGFVPQSLQSNFTYQITRVEAAQLMIQAYENVMKTEVPYIKGRFIDTNDISVSKAYALGLVTGVSDNTFEPNKHVTREQLCVMFDNLYKAMNLIQTNELRTTSFVDESEISAWSKDSVNLLYGLGIISGMEDGKMLPKGKATREQMILMIYELINYNSN